MAEKPKPTITDIVGTLPEGISLLFGDPVGKAVAVVSLFIKGSKWLLERNKKWITDYSEKCDLSEIRTDEDSAKYLQFMRTILMDIAYETNEAKREYVKNFALNYPRMIKENKFEEVMHYESLLSRLSDGHLRFLVFLSNYTHISGKKEWYAPHKLGFFETNTYGNSPLKKEIGIPMSFIEPIVNDLASWGIFEKRKEQNIISITFMGMYFLDYLFDKTIMADK